MNNQTIYVTGEARTTIDNAITKMFGTFYIAFEIILSTDEIINMDCNATLRLTRDFIKRIFLNHNIIKDEDITRLFDEAVSAEKEWWHYIIGDEILGMNKDSITAYIHYLANKRLNMIGFEARYPESKNPFKKLEELADIEGDGILKENMFEAARTSYQQMNTLGGLDDF